MSIEYSGVPGFELTTFETRVSPITTGTKDVLDFEFCRIKT